MSKEKAKGTAAETAVVNYLKQVFPHVERRTLNGKHDRGDVNLFPFTTIEVKDQVRMQLSTWLDEATVEGANANSWLNVVFHKRARKGSPKDWYVTMRGETFRQVLEVVNEYYGEVEGLEKILKILEAK